MASMAWYVRKRKATNVLEYSNDVKRIVISQWMRKAKNREEGKICRRPMFRLDFV